MAELTGDKTGPKGIKCTWLRWPQVLFMYGDVPSNSREGQHDVCSHYMHKSLLHILSPDTLGHRQVDKTGCEDSIPM